MVLLSRYWVLISINLFVTLIAIFNRRHYLSVNTSQQKTHEPYLENEVVVNKQENYQNFEKKLCKLDKLRLTNLENFDFSKHTKGQCENAIHAFIMDPTDTVCKERHRFGGG